MKSIYLVFFFLPIVCKLYKIVQIDALKFAASSITNAFDNFPQEPLNLNILPMILFNQSPCYSKLKSENAKFTKQNITVYLLTAFY